MQELQKKTKIKDVRDAIKALKRVNTAGHDGITVKMLLYLRNRV